MSHQVLTKSIKDILQESVLKLLGDEGSFRGEIPLERPAKDNHGDFASAVTFMLAKQLKKKPDEIAKQLADLISSKLPEEREKIIDRVEALGPFINIWLDKNYLAKNVDGILAQGESFGRHKKQNPEMIVVEYSGVNIGKPFGIGHLRSTVNGAAIANLLEASGDKVVRLNYLGDWGTQFGKLIAGYKHWGDAKALENDPVGELQRVYIKYHDEVAHDEALLKEGREWFKKLEQNDDEAIKLWQEFRTASLKNAQEIYDLLGVVFDDPEEGESRYRDKLKMVTDLLAEHDLLSKSEGAQIIDLEQENLPPMLIKKTDAASLYATREIAAAIGRYKKYNFDRMLYEVGAEQELHFRQIFAVLKKLDFGWANRLEHLKHGHYALDGKRMKSREGKTTDMKTVLLEAIKRADKVILEKNPELKNRKEVARQVGIGAVKYHDLSQNRLTNIQFDFDRMLSLDGNSAPYLQYTFARIQSVLKKAKVDPEKLAEIESDLKNAPDDEGQLLIRRFLRYPEAITDAAKKRMPHILATELFELASLYNLFYGKQQILKAPEPDRSNRLAISAATGVILQNGLSLLGIETPESM